jgi:hypothetical protein
MEENEEKESKPCIRTWKKYVTQDPLKIYYWGGGGGVKTKIGKEEVYQDQ